MHKCLVGVCVPDVIVTKISFNNTNQLKIPFNWFDVVNESAGYEKFSKWCVPLAS